MSKLYRSLLWSGLVVAGVAACGDDVTVTPPSSVSVAPTGVTIAVGQTLQMTAAVNVPSGTATTVTWTSSDAAKASVNASTGLVTGVAAGSVAISACLTANPGVCGAATVTVTSAATQVTISIQSITTGATFIPVNVNNVAGQIDVSLNLDPGTQGVSEVDVLIDGVVAAKQTFGAGSPAALRGDSTKANSATVLLSVNTADFNATTGATTYKNGARVLTAKVILANGSQKATEGTSLFFNNPNTFVATPTFTGTTASATGTAGAAAGLGFKRGGVTWEILPVIYNVGQTLAVGSTVTFGSGACDASGTGARTLALAAPATGSSKWTAAFPQTETGGAAATNVQNYEFSPAACGGLFPNGEGVIVAGVDNSGNAIIFAPLPAPNVPVLIRLDNRAPSGGGNGAGIPVINWNSGTLAMPNFRSGGWINKDVVLNGPATSVGTTSGATSNGFICNNTTGGLVGNCAAGTTTPTDAGINAVTITFKAAQTTSLTTAAAAAAATSATTESTTNTSYCGVAQAVDLLGNTTVTNATASTSTTCSTLIGAGATNIVRYGVDNTPPTAAVDVSSLTDGQRVAANPIGANFVLLVNDPGAPATASGIQGAKWLLTRVRADGTTNRDATGASTTATAPTSDGAPACGGGLCATAISGLATTTTSAAYWTAQGLVLDAAGNTSPTVTIRMVADATNPTVTGPSVPASISGAFNASGAASDNLDLRDFWFSITYSNATIGYLTPPVIQLNATPIAINTFPPVPGTLQNTNVALGATINTPLMLQSTTGAGAPNAYSAAAAGQALSGATVNVRDQTGPYVFPAVSPAPIAFASLVLPSSGISTTNFTSFITSASNTSLCALAAASLGCVVGTPSGTNFASTVITATASGATSVFNNPFGRVDFYCTNGAVLIALGSSSSAQLNDNGAVRTWAYSLTESAADLFAKCGGVAGGAPGASITPPLWAWGVTSAGTVALVAQPIATVTINP